MDKLHNSRMSPYEKIEALESIRCQIQGAWRTDEIRRQKPTPQVLRPSHAALLHACLKAALCHVGQSLEATRLASHMTRTGIGLFRLPATCSLIA